MVERSQEFDLTFNDPTMLEADGLFDGVNDIMTAEHPIPDRLWMLKTTLVILSGFGVAELELNLYSNKEIYITDYKPSQKDVFYNMDLSVLSAWAQDAGWAVPRPHPDLIRTKLSFWKHFWDLGVVDSDYLERLYKKKEEVDDDE